MYCGKIKTIIFWWWHDKLNQNLTWLSTGLKNKFTFCGFFQPEWKYINEGGSFDYTKDQVGEIRQMLYPDIEYSQKDESNNKPLYFKYGPDTLHFVSIKI